MKWQVDEMASGWNGKLMKWQVDEMASWWNGKLMKQQVDEMASWWIGKLMIWRADETASWWNGNWMKWQLDEMTNQWNGKLSNAKLVECQLAKLHIDKKRSTRGIGLNVCLLVTISLNEIKTLTAFTDKGRQRRTNVIKLSYIRIQ
jgi:hypothetical protein